MAYADLKNDVVFRKVFGSHPEVVRGLLNDLLDRTGEHLIASVEYLPPDQAPWIPGYKMSVVDVKCREVGGAMFVVEMQVLPVTGFINRVVYNACKAYVGTLLRGRQYETLTDVVALSICNFELWPDDLQDAAGQPRIPLVSRWTMAEATVRTGHPSFQQLQWAFCELPKLGSRTLVTSAEKWAALFVAAPMLTPEQVEAAGLNAAQREALELAREETFTARERDAVERMDEEVDQVRRIAVAAEMKGRDEGLAPLLRQFARKLSRPLTEAERATVGARLVTLGPERLGDVVLDLEGPALAAWLTDPSAV